MTDKETIVNVITSIAAAGNVILFLSQSPMIYKLIKEKDATKYTWLPSLTMMSTLSLWSGYTVFVYDPRLRADIYVGNFSGVIIPFIFLAVFVFYSKTWMARVRIIAATLAALGTTWGFCVGLFFTHPLDRATTISGGVVTFVNMLFFLSPLKAIYEALTSLDGSRLPLSMSIVMMFQAIPWVVAGILIPDPFILGVNATGCAFGCLQTAGTLFIGWRRRQLGLAPGQSPPWVKSVLASTSAADTDGKQGTSGRHEAALKHVDGVVHVDGQKQAVEAQSTDSSTDMSVQVVKDLHAVQSDVCVKEQ